MPQLIKEINTLLNNNTKQECSVCLGLVGELILLLLWSYRSTQGTEHDSWVLVQHAFIFIRTKVMIMEC